MKKSILGLLLCLYGIISIAYAGDSAQCDNIPRLVKQFKGASMENWHGYSVGDFVRYNNKVYQLKNDWWTVDSPGSNDHWVYCQDVLQPVLNLRIPSKPVFIASSNKPHIVIYDENHNQVVDLNNLDWGTNKKVNLPIGQFTIVVEGIGSSRGYASQGVINLDMAEVKKVSIKYKNSHAASLNIYPKAAISGNVGVKIIDSKGSVLYQGTLIFNKKNTIYDIPVAEGNDTVIANIYIANGRVYKAPDSQVSLFKDKTSNINLDFDSWPVAAARVDVAVTNLPKDREAKLKFMNNTGDVQTVSIKGNGVYTQMFDKDGSTWHLIADGIDGANIYPKSFNASQSCVNASVKSESNNRVVS